MILSVFRTFKKKQIMAENNNKGSREFSLSTLAVDNGTSIFILTLMILIFGVFSYQATPKEQYPEVDWPTVYINTPYFGNSAADIENLVTRPRLAGPSAACGCVPQREKAREILALWGR